MDDGTKSDGSWWRTVPGMLTATAATITALTGLVVALHQSGLLREEDKQGPPRPPVEARSDPTARSQQPPQGLPPEREKKAVEQSSAPATRETTNRPWSETQAVITSTEGTVTGVSAESLANCISANKELTLSSGQSIAFERMRSFEFVRESSKTTLVVTLLSGGTVKGSMNSMTMACDLIGQNQLGRVSVLFEKLKRVDFQR